MRVPSSPVVRILLVVAALCAVASVWLRYDNPEIDGTGRGDDYVCAAPYDTAARGETPNEPGGEPPADADDITARCTEAGRTRHGWSLVAGALVPVALLGAGAAQLRTRSARQPEPAAR